jgi:predicted deacylase
VKAPEPGFVMELAPPDLARWRAGEIAGVVSRSSGQPGPHGVLVALVHGNEIGGALVLDQLLRSGLAPLRGRLTCVFANLAAFDRFDPADPTASRYVEEDFNRLWDPALLDGPRRSLELDRARALRPVFDSADLLLDLHSMLWQHVPVLLCGATAKGRKASRVLGTPALIVSDGGHPAGPRLIDYPRFSEPGSAPVALLIEGGAHWERATEGVLAETAAAFLAEHGFVALPRPPRTAQRLAEVTQVVVAQSHHFAFTGPWRGGEVVRERGTLIALDGDEEIRTPHADCLLVMPALRALRGHTAVRLARFVD